MRYLEFYNHSEYAHFRRQERSGGKLGVDGILTHQSAHSLCDPATGDLVVGLTLSGSARAHWKVNDLWRTVDARVAGSIGISPLDEAVEFDVEAKHSLLVLAFNRRVVDDISRHYVEDCADLLNLAHHRYYFDTRTERLMKALWSALATKDATSDLMIDGFTQALFASMLNMLDATDESAEQPTVSLSELEQFIRAEMPHGLTVEKLAKVAGLPSAVFRIAFKHQQGCSPYHFVQQVRAQMAHSLLIDGRLSLMDISHQLGFADQSHFTRFCRKYIGMSPSLLRIGFCNGEGNSTHR